MAFPELSMSGQPVTPLFGNNCQECSEVCANLLRKQGVDAGFFLRQAASLSEDDAAYLVHSNPRLTELRRIYADSLPPELAPSRWSPGFVTHEVPFRTFRGDCAYVWQRRDLNTPASYVLTAYSLLAGPDATPLRRLTEDGAFGAYTLPLDESLLLSRDLLDSSVELAFLDRQGVLDGRAQRTIIDIGSGYGRFAHRLYEACGGLHSVLCVDAIPESTFICEYYLRYREVPPTSALVIELPRIPEILEIFKVDLAVNIHSFSECTLAAIEWWLHLLVARRVRWLFIVPNPGHNGAGQLTSTELNGERIPFDDLVLSCGYKLVTRQPKYANTQVQRYGITPTYYYLFELSS